METQEFVVTVFAVLAGFVVAKMLAEVLASYGVPIASGPTVPN